MKKLLPLLAVLLFMMAIRTPGAPMDTTGIPATAQGVLHLDLDAGRHSPFAVELGRRFLASSGRSTGDWQATLGFDPGHDVSGITIGLLPGSPASSTPQGVFILRGTFSPAKIIAAALQKEAKATTIGKYAFIDAGSLPGLIPFGKKGRILFAAIDSKTLLFADEATASAAVDALDGKTPSYHAPASLAVFARQAGTPFFYAHLDRALFPKPRADSMEALIPPDEVQIALGESSSNVVFRFTAAFPLAVDAQRAKARLQTQLGLFRMMLGNDGNSPQKTLAEKLSKLHAAAKITGTDRRFSLAVDFPADDAIWLLANAGKKTDGSGMR